MQLSKQLLFILTMISIGLQAQNIGVKTSSPQAVLDVNGSVAMREGTPLSITNGTNNNVVVDSMSFYRITAPTAVFSVTGFTNGFDGRMLTLINATSYTMTLKHLSTSSTAGNRINTGGSDMAIAANGVVTMYYNAALANWTVTSTQGSPPSFSSITTGGSGDSIITINNGILGRVRPVDYVETYAWGIDGNASTVDGTHFLGTTDAIPLNFRVNNQKAGRISHTNDNTYFGYQSGNVTTGTGNTFIGYQVGDVNTSGESNTVVGANAFGSNTGGKDNVAIGFEALKVNTGDDNTAIGKLAMTSNTSGQHNVAVGEAALQLNTTGVQNTALGREALYANTIGRDNTALGYNALRANTTGDRSVAIGKNALITQSYNNGGVAYNTQNVAIGYESLSVNQPTSSSNGINNTAVGYQSGKANTTGTNNTFIGNYAGEVNTTGSNNATLGYQAGNNITTGSTNIAIGYQATVPTATASNQLSIGNWIYGVSGNIGIGCTAPGYKLHVNGDGGFLGSIRATGSITAGTTVTACSDLRFKTNIHPLSNALQNVLKLQGVTYDWRIKDFPEWSFNDRKQIGVIAQDLEKVYPELIVTDEKGYRSVDYSKMTPILIEAVKDLNTEKEQLKAEIERLKGENSTLKKIVETNSKDIEQIKQMLAKKGD